MNITADLLEEALLTAAGSYAPGELAYLALTSKPELAVRDRLSWVLHRQLAGNVVAREWGAPGTERRRTDLAILDASGRRPLALVEVKAAYTFDFASMEQRSSHAYRARVEKDLKKARIAAGEHPAGLYGLVLLTHPVGLPVALPGVIKYLPDIRHSLAARTPETLQALASETAQAHFAGMGSLRSGKLDGGEAFGVKTLVHYWLIGPASV